MSDKKISQLNELDGLTATANDFTVVVDISDTTMAESGTTKKITLGDVADVVQRENSLIQSQSELVGTGLVSNIFTISQTAYDSLAVKDPATLYVII
jgi:hypothetical protein